MKTLSKSSPKFHFQLVCIFAFSFAFVVPTESISQDFARKNVQVQNFESSQDVEFSETHLQALANKKFKTLYRRTESDELDVRVRKERCMDRQKEDYTVDQYESNGFLILMFSGGLNQQRRAIVNGIAVAKMLNATLVLPRLTSSKAWVDQSNFEDLFDVDHFISTLKDDLRIIKTPPNITIDRKLHKKIFLYLTKVEYSVEWYLVNALPILKEHGILKLKILFHLPSALPPPLQRLRCRGQFEALRFAKTINDLGMEAVDRLKEYGKYIAIHVRLEADWLIHGGCMVANVNAQDLQSWAQSRRVQINEDFSNSQQKIREGKCPYTAAQLALILKALEVDSKTKIFIAGGKFAGGDKAIVALENAFPGQIVNKFHLLGSRLNIFSGRASMYAAIDYIVSLHSDFLILTAGSNMALMLKGHRYYNGDVLETYRPKYRRLMRYFYNPNLNFNKLKKEVRKQRMAGLNGRGRNSFYGLPWECMCQNKSQTQTHI